ncbi:pectin esterase [Alteromonas pelagimontana]|uniref:Pectinesterase n=2 Tax=Alteromonas pelagimontana TaxID=1858656 RepID=A0A6M4MJY6_9ALTE|nr:pectin esterase [Alteromonas pelagimontana]
MMALLIIFAVIHPAAMAYETHLTVAKDGSGDYRTIKQAILATKAFPWEDITIFIKNGVYHEKVDIYAWNTRVHLVGENRNKTIISYDDHFKKLDLGRNSTFHTYTMRVAGNDFSASNLTIENTAGPVGQAVALHVEADRAAFTNVTIRGYQDTLYVVGEGHRSYFENCRIEGSVDFIFGEGTAYFEQCDVVSLMDNTYVTAASTPKEQPFGFVFNRSKFIAPDKVKGVYLGRPWRQFARTVIVNSELGSHVHPAGWNNWGDATKEKTAFYAEMNNSGPGAKLDNRVSWSHQLAAEDAEKYSLSNVLRGWQPSAIALPTADASADSGSGNRVH